MEIASEENLLLSMGPQHPSTHGVLRLLVELEGETIVNAAPDIGFLIPASKRIWSRRRSPSIGDDGSHGLSVADVEQSRLCVGG